jgi:hypothetical protein
MMMLGHQGFKCRTSSGFELVSAFKTIVICRGVLGVLAMSCTVKMRRNGYLTPILNHYDEEKDPG